MIKPLLLVEFDLDIDYTEQIRTVQTIADLLSQVGGFMGIVVAIASVLIGPIQEQFFI